MNVSADIDRKDLPQEDSARKDLARENLARKDLGQPAADSAMPRYVFPGFIVLLGALFALVPYWGDDVQMRESFLLAAVYITLASNLNIMIGYTGYINFGNIVFFGLGGYICIDLVTRWQWPLVA